MNENVSFMLLITQKTDLQVKSHGLNRRFGNAAFFRVQDYVPLKSSLNSRTRLHTRTRAACESAQVKIEWNLSLD